MFFEPLLDSDEQRAVYRRMLADFGTLLGDYTQFVVRALDTAHAAMAGDPRYCHATILTLSRHVASTLDGVAILVAQGCAEASAVLLRSTFEGSLGVGYILKADHERRGLAYQVAHIHRKIKLYRRVNAADDLGRELRAELAGQPFADVLDHVPGDPNELVERLERVLREPHFVPIQAEWAARKKTKDGRQKQAEPPWFSLFGGPKDVKGLAKELDQLALYQFLYKQWSDIIHAGSGMNNIAMTRDGVQVIRPIRHPGELQAVVRIATGLGMQMADMLVTAYRADLRAQFRAEYEAELQPRFRRLCVTDIEFPSWH